MLVEEIMKRDYAVIDTDKPITYALKLMKKADADGFLVAEGEGLAGLASYWDLMLRLMNVRVRGADASSIYVSSVMEPVSGVLSPKSRVVEAAQKIAGDPFHMIPVLEGKKLVGVVEAVDLAKALLEDEVPASSVCLRNAPIVNVSDRIIHARKLMLDSGLRSLAVANEDVVIGVVNDDQVVEAYVNLILRAPAERQKAQVKSLLVSDLGPRHVKVDVDASLAEVSELMLKSAVKGIPILESASLAGFVSVAEIAKFIAAQA